MKKIKLILFFLILNLTTISLAKACDLLSINIGGDKSEIEDIFGPIEVDEDDEESVSKFTSSKEGFCTDIDLGEVLIHGYIMGDKIAAVEIEVQNGPENKESAKKKIYDYAQNKFGGIEVDSNKWIGYKLWDVDNKQIFYYNHKDRDNNVQEGIAVTSVEYYRVLADDE